MTKILLVEDDVKISRYMSLELAHEGYSPTAVTNGADALEIFDSEDFALILLDLMLPGVSGVEICRRIRKKSNVPIIMVTAKDSTSDKVSGLDVGADDYLAKPFEIEELLARIRALLRRGAAQVTRESVYSMADLTMNVSTKMVERAGTPLSLTKREFELLQYLLENRDIVLSRESLLQNVWQWEFAGETNTVDVYIRYLRDKVDKPFDRPLIHTVRGFGYVIRDDENK
ncbi:MAG: response regulator transcription factor [Spirochaetales bacterium]|nr:response regulator transcription factor [Spirochaetales bacterium]